MFGYTEHRIDKERLAFIMMILNKFKVIKEFESLMREVRIQRGEEVANILEEESIELTTEENNENYGEENNG